MIYRIVPLLSVFFSFRLSSVEPPLTLHLSSPEEIFSRYDEQTAKFPEHISFVTAQSEKFLAYEIIARTVFEKAHPESSHSNMCFIRYPSAKAPKDLDELFDRFPLREDYDTVSSSVARYLVAASPSLKEDDDNESALAMFRNNTRDGGIADFIGQIFKEEHIASDIYQERIRQLLEEAPRSEEGGVLTQIFLPKVPTLHKVVYHSHAYGIPVGGLENVKKVDLFFKEYSEGKVWGEEPVPQLRFLPSGLTEENGFNSGSVHIVRYTLAPSEALQIYAEKVKASVSRIFEEQNARNLELDQQVIEAFQDAKEESLIQLSKQHLACSDAIAAINIVNMISDENPQKPFCLTAAISGLIEQEECELAESAIFSEWNTLPQKNVLLARLALVYIDHGKMVKVNELLELFSESPQKNFILSICKSLSQQDLESQFSPLYSQNAEELMEQGVLEFPAYLDLFLQLPHGL